MIFPIITIFTLIWPINYGFIIPDEVPSLLSVIYSNIPTVKKGTDSRIGWGFRLGDRADFQVMVELGPQTNTQPLANQGDNNNSKRNSINTLSNVLYAQRQREKQQKKQISNTDGGKWLDNWRQTMTEDSKEKLAPRPGLAIGEIDAKSVLPEEPQGQLAQLYKYGAKPPKTVKSTTTTTQAPRKIIQKDSAEDEGPLDDVSLE